METPKATEQRQPTPQIDIKTGYIDYKVDFVEQLSEDDSNSWCEEASVSAGGGAEEYYDEEDCDSPMKHFD